MGDVILMLGEVYVALLAPNQKSEEEKSKLVMDLTNKRKITLYLEEADPAPGLKLGCCFDISSRCLAFSIFN